MSDKYCINCTHFYLPSRVSLDSRTFKTTEIPEDPKYGMCKRLETPRSLVTGKHEAQPYEFCSAARISPCGASGRYFHHKDIPVTQEEDEAFNSLENKHV